MVDFEGQRISFIASAIIMTLSVPLSILYSFMVNNFLKGLNVIIYSAILCLVLFVPDWPYLNRSKLKWQSDSSQQKIKQN